uniref:Signal transducer and activator of transcription linker domain-containing protein n=1 Tax=Phlebotomus papatasi TaxID=29031 RepID=A0A1B0DFX6_PHLPP
MLSVDCGTPGLDVHDRVFVEDPSCTEIPMRLISWNNITKDNMPGMNFTFWNWFYKAMKLVKDTYKEAWMSGHILGFIHREKAKGLLEGSRPFTFLFRFSESIEGIVIGGQTTGVSVYNRKATNL